jgi:hypothetical protein
MQTIHFTWNCAGKLDKDTFTTIRLPNKDKYFGWAKFRVCLNGNLEGIAEIVQIQPRKLRTLKEEEALKDTGLSLADTKELLKGFYGQAYEKDGEEMRIDLLYFRWIDRQPKLF